MRSDYKKALETIVKLCEAASYRSSRVERIADVAFHALGMPECQRKHEIWKIRHNAIARYRQECQDRAARKLIHEAREAADSLNKGEIK